MAINYDHMDQRIHCHRCSYRLYFRLYFQGKESYVCNPLSLKSFVIYAPAQKSWNSYCVIFISSKLEKIR